MYLDEIDTVFNKPDRNEDRGKRGPGMTIFTNPACPIGPISRSAKISQELRDSAHWFLLFNSPDVEPYLEYVVPSLMCIA